MGCTQCSLTLEKGEKWQAYMAEINLEKKDISQCIRK